VGFRTATTGDGSTNAKKIIVETLADRNAHHTTVKIVRARALSDEPS